MTMQNEQDVWRESWLVPDAQAQPDSTSFDESVQAAEQENGEIREEKAETPAKNGERAKSDTTENPSEIRNAQEKREQLYPPYKPEPFKPPKIHVGEEHLLFIQIILCAALLAFVFFSNSIGASFLPDLRTELDTILTTGVDFSTDNVFARFADAAVEELRLKISAFLKKLEEPAAIGSGEGGFWPVDTSHEVPEGATLDEYELPIELFPPLSDEIVLTSGYGFRQNPVNGTDDFHAGIDIAAAEGTPVRAAQGGIVVRAGYTRLRGYYVVLRHSDGVQTLYQHLSLIFVRGGEIVTGEQTIAAVGSTGFVTGPHLHFELILNGVRVDPARAFATKDA